MKQQQQQIIIDEKNRNYEILADLNSLSMSEMLTYEIKTKC